MTVRAVMRTHNPLDSESSALTTGLRQLPSREGEGGREGGYHPHPCVKNVCRLPVFRTRLETEVPLSDVVVMDSLL